MKNRYKNSKLVSSAQSRLSQVAYEKERGFVQAETEINRIIEPISKQKIDYNREHYRLIKRFTPGPNDVIFDRFAIIATDKGVFIIFDKRLKIKEYSEQFLNSLPSPISRAHKYLPFKESLNEIEGFYKQL